VLQAVFFCRLLLLLHFLLLLKRRHDLLGVEVVQDREVLDQLLDVGAEVAAAGRARQDVARSQVHETVLAKSVSAS